MQEIALLLSSLAGIATAAAVRARTGSSGQILTLGASSQIQSQIKALKMEKEVLAKTITRLYQAEWEMPREQKEGLLARYQRQMGMVMARLEKMEDAKRHPDLGPVGDGLITLMDQKLSGLDAKIYDISSAVADIKAVQQKVIAPGKAGAQGTGGAGGVAAAAAPTTVAPTVAAADTKVVPDMPIPGQKRVRPFEITTLTSIPAAKKPEFRIKTDEKKVPAAAVAEQQAATEAPVTQRQEQIIQQPRQSLQEQLPVEKPAAVQKEDAPEKESAAVEKEEEEKKMPDVSSLIVPDVATAIVPKTIPDTAGTKDAAADKPGPATLPSPAAAAIAGGKVTPPKQDEGEAARLTGDDGGIQGGADDGKEEEEDDKELEEAISDIKKTLEKLDRAESE